MTLNQHEKQRLLQALQDDPVFLAQARSLILSAELVQLPERFAQFATNVTAFIERQERFNAAVEDRLQRITDDLGDLKGNVAGRIARYMADDIAEHLGYGITHQLDGNDLRRMLRQHDPADLPSGDRRSFYVADLFALVQDPDGNELYIAAEASYTADERDTRRAIRNVQLINGFTGMTAVPVIASLGNDQAVQQLVDRGAIRWFQFQPRDLQPQ